MALTQAQIDQYSADNRSGFNYVLPDGTTITTSVNPGYAATVDTKGILAGQTAAPIPQYLLQVARDMQTALTGSATAPRTTDVGSLVTDASYTPSLATGTDPSKQAPDPFSTAGAANISAVAGQPVATAQTIADQSKLPGYIPIPTSQTIEAGLSSAISGYGPSSYTGPSIVDYLDSLGKPSDPASRATLASQFGITNYTGTAEQNTQLLNTLRSLGPMSGNTAASPVTALGLTSAPGTPLNVTGTFPTGTNTAGTMVAGADAASRSIQDYINLLTGPKSAEQLRLETLSKEIEGDLEGLKGRGAAQLEAEKAAGVDLLKKSLADVNALMATKMAQYRALTTDVEGKPITMNSIIGSQAQIQKVMAADIGLLQAQAQGLMGQVKAAQETADRAVDLKYEDAETAINIRFKQLELLEGQLTKSETVRAQAITLYLQDQQRIIDERKAAEKEATSFALDGMSKYPSAGISITDDYATVQRKILASPEYQLEQDRAAKLASAVTGGSGGGTSNQMTDNERALMSQFRGEQIVKDYNEILSQKGTIDSYIQNGVGGPADLALVFSFMKGLDPNSVVRETEYETAAKSGNIFAGVFAKFNGYFKENGGFLPESVKNEFQNLVNQKLAVKQAQYDNLASQYTNIASRQGLDPSNVVIDYASGGYTAPVTNTPTTQTTQTSEPTSSGGLWGSITNWLFGND